MALRDKLTTTNEQIFAGKKALADALIQVGITAVEPNPNVPDKYETFQSYADKIKRLMVAPPKAGDIAYVSAEDNTIQRVPNIAWSSDLGQPVGVVVIPPNFLPDGKMRIMGMYAATSAGMRNETSHVSLQWCPTSAYTDIPWLDNLNEVPVLDFETNTISGKTSYAYLPSDYFTQYPNPWDVGTAYYYNPSGSSKPIPSPYGTDGALNPLYIATEYSGGTIDNALADFKGKENTDILVGLGSDYIAANAARNYKSYDGDTIEWYLPACGELGFICARRAAINEALEKIGGLALTSGSLWSSSEYSSNYARRGHLDSGTVSYNSKTSSYYVRAFALL